MALDFFKKKNKKEETETEETSVRETKKNTGDNNSDEEPAVPHENNVVMKSKEEVDEFITKKFDVFENTPFKLLWNIHYGKNADVKFDPMEYVYKPLIETNMKLNEINKDTNDAYVDYDENQREFMDFVKHVQMSAARTFKELYQNSIDDEFDEFVKDVDKAAFENETLEYCGYKSFEEYRRDCESERSETREKPMDSQVIFRLSKDRLHAWVVVFPPVRGGSPVREDTIRKVLADNKIIYGVNAPLIGAIVGKKKYMQIFEIARGIEVIHGKDGYVIDKYPRKNVICIKEDENGNLNYKELNNVKSVHTGDIISEIYYPIEGSDGKCVDGRILNARKGAKPKIPKGKNTALSEDGKYLCSETDGELVFKEGVFRVNELLTIENDVDNASGNINFSGDVLIKGDVREGFSVKAEGNITVEGTCEGAYLEADGDINIHHGMTGGGKGVIKAGGNLTCIFLENCSAYAKGIIEVNQVMYSELSCGDSIIVSGKKGSVTGGKLIAGRSITAEVIGAANNSYLETEIVLGATPELIRKHTVTGCNLKEVTDNLFRVNQDINYIAENINRMPADRVAKLKQLKIQQKFMTMQKNNLEETLAKLTEELEETKKACSLKCITLNPTINFKVGESRYTLLKQLNNAHLYVKDNVAVISSSSIAESITF